MEIPRQHPPSTLPSRGESHNHTTGSSPTCTALHHTGEDTKNTNEATNSETPRKTDSCPSYDPSHGRGEAHPAPPTPDAV
jgi:hypothetical protein